MNSERPKSAPPYIPGDGRPASTDCSTIRGRVAYILARDPDAKESWHLCARGVWMTFYAHLFHDGFPRMGDIHKIPTITAIRREWRKQTRAAAVRASVPEKPPYYADMP